MIWAVVTFTVLIVTMEMGPDYGGGDCGEGGRSYGDYGEEGG